MVILDKVLFNPSQCVTYQPDSSKQQVELTIENTSDTTVMFKMKSTRPGVYKMRPVYDIIAAGDKKTVRLIFKGLKPNQQPPARDHFTVILAPALTSSTNVSKLWNNHKYHMKLANSELKRKTLMILYAGVNDNIPLAVHDDGDFDENGVHTRKSMIKKTKGLVDCEGLQGTVPSALNATPASIVPAGRPVLVMFRPGKQVFSDSETDKSEDEEQVKPTVEENKATVEENKATVEGNKTTVEENKPTVEENKPTVEEVRPPEMKPTTKPPSGVQANKPLSGVQANKPSSAVTPRKPSSVVTTRKPSSGVSPRKPSSGVSPRKPSSAVTHRKPSSGVSPRKPSSVVSPRKPSSGVSPRKPSSGVSPRKPSTVTARKASSQVAKNTSAISGKPRSAASKCKK